MSETMMALGEFRFALNTATYEKLTHAQAFRWPAQERVGVRPARQFVGQGDETLEFSGVVYPAFRGGLAQVEQMREQAARGQPLLLVDGLGKVWGLWVVLEIREDATVFLPNGVARKQSFQLRLSHYGND